jgi:hypothetical protein
MKSKKELLQISMEELVQIILDLQEEKRRLKEELAAAKKSRPSQK